MTCRAFDAVLLVAFGGPTRPEDIRPFLANIARGRPIPEERLEEVAHHYEIVGGRSPLNELTERQASCLESELARRGIRVPVRVGMRNWRPWLGDVLRELAADGLRRVFAIIMSAQQTEASWDRYRGSIAEAVAGLAPLTLEVTYAPAWHDHPLYLAAFAGRVETAFRRFVPAEPADVHLLFTAHSIPAAMARRSPYAEQVEAAAREVARLARHPRWSVAYQSRSGGPSEPWLEPDVNDAIRALAAGGTRNVIAVPIGFVCDHVEVLYDLDVEARQTAEACGVRLVRAGTLNDHPDFIRLLADLVCGASGESPACRRSSSA